MIISPSRLQAFRTALEEAASSTAANLQESGSFPWDLRVPRAALCCLSDFPEQAVFCGEEMMASVLVSHRGRLLGTSVISLEPRHALDADPFARSRRRSPRHLPQSGSGRTPGDAGMVRCGGRTSGRAGRSHSRGALAGGDRSRNPRSTEYDGGLARDRVRISRAGLPRLPVPAPRRQGPPVCARVSGEGQSARSCAASRASGAETPADSRVRPGPPPAARP